MKKVITTKDLMALNELMIFEKWMTTKMLLLSESAKDADLKKCFKDMSPIHAAQHKNLLDYLKTNGKAS